MKIKVYESLPQEAINIRITVFVDEQGFVDEIDEIDGYATHLLLFDEADTPVATCRIFTDEDTYILGRLCVLKEHRRKGAGSLILKEAEKVAKQKGGCSLILHSQLQAKGFYEKSGYSQFGELEYEQDQPHIWMRKEL